MAEDTMRTNRDFASAGGDPARLLEGRVALVTGGSRGIGAATAVLLAQHGAAVGVNYHRNESAAQTVVDRIVRAGGQAIAVQADVGDEQQVRSMAERVNAVFGPIDTLVLNATAIPRFVIQPFMQFGWDEFEAMVAGGLKGAFVTCKALVPSMVERKQGCIIAISSGLSRSPLEGFSAHSAGKSALDALVKALALELGPSGIRVNAVAPGLIETEASSVWSQAGAGRIEQVAARTPMRRPGDADDVAGAVLFLASPLARFVTGTYLPVSGGIQML